MGVITVDTRDRKPIYEQLTENIRRLVLQGILQPNEQLPSVRALAVELAINPNTIQKAYAELERQGIITRAELHTEEMVYASEKYGVTIDPEKLEVLLNGPYSAPSVEEIISGALTEKESIGIIGGADGPTAIIVGKPE